MKRRLPLAAYLLVVGMGAFGLWRIEAEINDRIEADCRQSIALRAADEENDVELVNDIAEAVIAHGGEVPQSIRDYIAERIAERYDQLPPPADCTP